MPRVPCSGVPPALVLRERCGYSACLPGLLCVPGLSFCCLALRCLAGCLLGALAGARLDLVGGERALRRARTAIGSPPRDGQAVARAESRQVNARDMLEVSGALGGRAQLKPKVRR